jgi:hypothetical protein
VRKIICDEFSIEDFFFLIERRNFCVAGGIGPGIANHFSTGSAKSGGKLSFRTFTTMALTANLPCLQMSPVRVDQDTIDVKNYAKFWLQHESNTVSSGENKFFKTV